MFLSYILHPHPPGQEVVHQALLLLPEFGEVDFGNVDGAGNGVVASKDFALLIDWWNR